MRDARPNDGRCGNVSEALEAEFGWQQQHGYLLLLDRTVSWVHCWNLADERTIIDATADQYQDLWLGDIVVLDPSSPYAGHYLPGPRQWKLEFHRNEESGAIEAIRCTCGDDVQLLSPAGTGRPWLVLAYEVLGLLTGWELDNRLCELAARALRAKASTSETTTSAELLHPLFNESMRHLGSRGTQPWIAQEFLEPL